MPKQSERSLELDGKMPPRSSAEYFVWYARRQARLGKERAERRAEREREQLAIEQQREHDRAAAYAEVGVIFDKRGIARWASNGQPLIGGRRQRGGGWR